METAKRCRGLREHARARARERSSSDVDANLPITMTQSCKDLRSWHTVLKCDKSNKQEPPAASFSAVACILTVLYSIRRCTNHHDDDDESQKPHISGPSGLLLPPLARPSRENERRQRSGHLCRATGAAQRCRGLCQVLLSVLQAYAETFRGSSRPEPESEG